MKLIAHRGNLSGSDLSKENDPQYVEIAISKGFDVEIDIRYNTSNRMFYLGHDEPQYIVSWFWLAKYKDYLWIHCKDIQSLFEFTQKTSGFNYFWHQNDDFTLTSKNYIWTYPGKTYTNKSIIVMPELNNFDFDLLKSFDCYGICSDYVEKLK